MTLFEVVMCLVGVAAALVLTIGFLALITDPPSAVRARGVSYETEFVRHCADSQGQVIVNWRGEVSCAYPVGVLPPDLSNH